MSQPNYPIFICNIPPHTKTEEIRDCLSSLLGAINDVRVQMGKNRGKKIKRVAIVHCSSSSQRDTLLDPSIRLETNGCRLKVKSILNKDQRTRKNLDKASRTVSVCGRLPTKHENPKFWMNFEASIGVLEALFFTNPSES